MNHAQAFGRLYLGTLVLVAIVWLGYLLYRHVECDRRGGMLVRGVFWMECVSRASAPGGSPEKEAPDVSR